MRIKEIKAQRFGELLVLDDFSKVLAKRSRRFLKYKCSCGNIAFVEKSKVLRGHTLSCGHLQREIRKNLGELKKLPYGEACENETYKCYQKNALKRGYEFALSKEEFRNIITQPCSSCPAIFFFSSISCKCAPNSVPFKRRLSTARDASVVVCR